MLDPEEPSDKAGQKACGIAVAISATEVAKCRKINKKTNLDVLWYFRQMIIRFLRLFGVERKISIGPSVGNFCVAPTAANVQREYWPKQRLRMAQLMATYTQPRPRRRAFEIRASKMAAGAKGGLIRV